MKKIVLRHECNNAFCDTCRLERELLKSITVDDFMAMKVAEKIIGYKNFLKMYGDTWTCFLHDYDVVDEDEKSEP